MTASTRPDLAIEPRNHSVVRRNQVKLYLTDAEMVLLEGKAWDARQWVGPFARRKLIAALGDTND